MTSWPRHFVSDDSVTGIATSTTIFDALNATSSQASTTSQVHVFTRHTWTSFLAVHSPAALYVDRTLTPLWYIVGLAGNILSAKIWSERPMRRNNSSAVYLIALSISDLIFLSLHVLQELKYAWWVRTLEYSFICESYFLLVLAVQYLSPALVLGFTVERFIAVCLPFSKERWCTSRRATKVVAGLVAGCFCLCAIQAYFWTYNSKTGECEIRAEVMDNGNLSLWSVWSWSTEMLIFFIAPLIMFVFNVLVIREIHRLTSRCRESRPYIVAPPTPTPLSACPTSSPRYSGTALHPTGRLGCGSGDDGFRGGGVYLNLPRGGVMNGRGSIGANGHGGGSGGAATTVMLLSVSFYVIVTTLPATLVYVLHSQFPEGNVFMTDDDISRDATWRRYLAYITTRKIVEEICLSHYACNVFLYLITGDKFRQSLCALLRRRCCRWCWNDGPGTSGV